MNENEYGKSAFNRTDDGKKELRISDSDSIIGALKENGMEPGAENIDQITIIDEETGQVKRIIESDRNVRARAEAKRGKGSAAFAVGIIAFMAVVLLIILFVK